MIKVQNKYVKILNGEKEVVVHNYIYDTYLEYVHNSQLLDQYFIQNNAKKRISGCYLKLDEPITDFENAVYTDFDLCIREKNSTTTGNKNSCDIIYNFDSSYSITDAQDMGYADNIDLEEYIGKKITAIGFFNAEPKHMAFVDTTDFNIYITEEQSLVILREDVFSTNMECIGVDFPYHLAPTNKWYKQRTSPTNYYGTEIFARLYSIGFGSTKGIMRQEYKLDDEEIIINKTNTSFNFSMKTGEKITIYPHTALYCGNGKYPLAEYSEREILPQLSLYPASNKYPLKANVRYIIYKYELCTHDANSNIVHLNEFYTMNIFSNYIGLFVVETKTERRN